VVVRDGVRPYNLRVMSSTASLLEVSSSEVRRRNPAVRILYYAVCLVLAASIVALWWLYWIAHSALPQLDGSVSVPGISSKVRVVRDGQGVPTIEAAALEDLFFAQGYVTAQDRLWQMDIVRRAAAGELSEVIGEATVKMDREQRILGVRIAAEAAEKNLSARDRAYFDAYARGVNAFVDSHRDRLSLEFRLLKYAPRPWTVTDSMLVGARMVEDLNHYRNPPALTREKILAKLGPELTADLYVNSSWRDRPPGDVRRMEEEPGVKGSDEEDDDEEEVDPEGGGRMISGLAKVVILSGAKDLLSLALTRKQVLRFAQDDNTFSSARASDAQVSEFSSVLPYALSSNFTREEADSLRPGSNNWVVSGQHTVSGKPLLSNDMHLDHQMPNLWFAAHLRTTGGGFDVAGVTLPGIPFVIVGHNQRIGWGFTNVGPTVEDDFIEEFNAAGQYKTPAGWVEPQHRRETIHVKGKPDVTLDVVTTRHGPIVTELLPGETRKIALRWTLQDGMGQVFFDVNSAQNWNEFRKAFSTFGAPGQNVMYADVDGHIGYQATGRIPIRAAGDGSLPVTSGKVLFLSTRCRMFMIRPRGFWRRPMGASLPMATNIRSARNGMRRGERIASTACSNRARSLLRRICWRCNSMCRRRTTGSAPTNSCTRSITRRRLRSGQSGQPTFCATGMGGWRRIRRRLRLRPRRVWSWRGYCWSRSWVRRRLVRIQVRVQTRLPTRLPAR
jgi:penicillin amidase